MPGRYDSSICLNCNEDQVEDTEHKLTNCLGIVDAWLEVIRLIESLGRGLTSVGSRILKLQFGRSPRDAAVTWILGSYVEMVEEEVSIRRGKLSARKFFAKLKADKVTRGSMAVLDIGYIPGLGA